MKKCLHASWTWKINGKEENAEACQQLFTDKPLGKTNMFHEIKEHDKARKVPFFVIECKCK